MKKFLLLAMMGAMLAQGSTIEYSGGDISIADGDVVRVRNGATLTLGAGVALSNVTFQVYRDDGVAGQLIINEGAKIMDVSFSGLPAYDGTEVELPRVTMNGGEVTYSMVNMPVNNLLFTMTGGRIGTETVYNSNRALQVNTGTRFIHKGGTIDTVLMHVYTDGYYELDGGILTSSNFYVQKRAGVEPRPCAVMKSGKITLKSMPIEHGWLVVCGEVEGMENIEFQVPQNTGDEGFMRIENVESFMPKGIYVGAGGNSTRRDYTGHVEVVNSRLRTVNNLSAHSDRPNSQAYLMMTNSYWWHTGSVEMGALNDVKPGGATSLELVDSDVLIGGNEKTTLYTLADVFDVTNDELYGWSSYGLMIGRDCVLTMRNSRLRATDRLFLRQGATINIEENSQLITRRVNTSVAIDGCTNPININLRSGVWSVNEAMAQIGREFNASDYKTGERHRTVPSIFITQTGGLFTNKVGGIEMGGYSTNGVVRWEISGGALGANTYFKALTNAVMEVARRGTLASQFIAGFELDADAQNDCLLDFVLDRSEGNVNEWIFTDGGKARMVGNLRVRPAGGALITTNTTFKLMRTDQYWHGGASVIYHGTLVTYNNGTAKTERFRSLPDETLWTGTLSADNNTYSVTLTEPMSAADLATGRACGSVALEAMRTSNLKELNVDFTIQGTDEALEQIVENLRTEGYTNSCLVAENTLRMTVPGEFIPNNTPSRLIFDFTSTSARSSGAATTNATISAISLSREPIVKGFSIIIR